MIVKNKAFRKAMKEAGLEKVQLTKDNGMFTLYSADNETSNKIFDMYDSQIAGIFAFNQLSIDKWVKEIKEMFDNLENESDVADCSMESFLKEMGL